MKKGIIKLLTISLFFFASVLVPARAFAYNDPSLSVRLEEPKSPTREDSFQLSFTVLDLENRASTVQCFVKKPSDASFAQFDSNQILLSVNVS